MSHDVFISHSTKDRDVANRICTLLEDSGLSCWIAPRDIEPGEPWDEAIVRGVDNCLLVLLLFSEVSNDSPHVKREIQWAMEQKKALLPVRIADIQPGVAMTYSLIGIQWFDAFTPPVESHFADLKQRVQRIVSQVQIRASGAVPVAGGNAASATPPAPTTSVAAPAYPPPSPPSPTPALPPYATSETPTPAPAPVAPPAVAVAKPLVALLFQRNMQPDGYVLEVLEKGFKAAGYDVFADRMPISMTWAREIERNIKAAEAVIPILSESSMRNEMVNYQVEIARSAATEQGGLPKLLPVRVGYDGSLGETLDAILKTAPTAIWNAESDNDAIVKELLDSIRGKAVEPVDEEAIRNQQPGGAVPTNSRFYIPRPSDEALAQALRRKDTIVLIKGGRQMGKTSLMARGLVQARASGSTVVYTDLQKLNTSDLLDIKDFYFSLAHMLADQLDVDVDIDDTWKERRAPSVNFEQYLKKEIMPKVTGHLFWALDEVDRLFTTEFGSEVFGLFRSWHNERASNPDTPWNDMTLIIAYATEAHLFIADPNQSPFNVGTRLELRDFNIEQEEELNKLFGSPLLSEVQIGQFYELLNGQPYLVGRGLHELATSKMPFDEFTAMADRDEGPFGDHLRRILVMLCRDPKMVEAVKQVLEGSSALTMESFYRLRAAGIVVGEGAFNAKMRCVLYANYLRGHLRESA